MQGEIGSLAQDGKQIGGFLNWAIDPILTSSVRAEGKVYKMVAVKATAQKFWLLSAPSGGEITALYYQLVRDKLVLITQAQVSVELSGASNKMINKPIEMIWTS